MKYEATPVTAESIARATWRAQRQAVEITRLAESLKKDPDKKARLEKRLCKVCYYSRGSRIGGAAMTFRDCGSCGKEQSYGSTITDVLCLDCARELSLCKHCGADINGVPRSPNTKSSSS